MRPADAAADRIAGADWPALAAALDGEGYVLVPLLSAAECGALAALWDNRSEERRVGKEC